ncbi:MAG: hypothetical protein AAB225_24405 [Acidobacteriota bacterium]
MPKYGYRSQRSSSLVARERELGLVKTPSGYRQTTAETARRKLLALIAAPE